MSEHHDQTRPALHATLGGVSALILFSALLSLSVSQSAILSSPARDLGPDRTALRELSGVALKVARGSFGSDQHKPNAITPSRDPNLRIASVTRSTRPATEGDPAPEGRRLRLELLNLPPPRC